MAKKIRALRLAAGMSQVTLAKRAAISRTHVRRIEKAEQEPTVSVIERIAKALGVKPGELFE